MSRTKRKVPGKFNRRNYFKRFIDRVERGLVSVPVADFGCDERCGEDCKRLLKRIKTRKDRRKNKKIEEG
jgi:hypothetical protein